MKLVRGAGGQLPRGADGGEGLALPLFIGLFVCLHTVQSVHFMCNDPYFVRAFFAITAYRLSMLGYKI
jgi:hypothetical protein